MNDDARTRGHIPWSKVDARLRSLREICGARATIFVQGDVVVRVRPRLVMAWEYATCSSRTDWRFNVALSRA
jgi:hypothetical protein